MQQPYPLLAHVLDAKWSIKACEKNYEKRQYTLRTIDNDKTSFCMASRWPSFSSTNDCDTSWTSSGCLWWRDASKRCRSPFGKETDFSAWTTRALVMVFNTLVGVLLDATSAFSMEGPVSSSGLHKTHEHMISCREKLRLTHQLLVRPWGSLTCQIRTKTLFSR